MEPAEITGLLKAWTDGDRQALDHLMPLIYDELRSSARRLLRNERDGNTLQTTGLVNEAYLRLIHVKNVDWHDRAQFFALSANIMRRILVDAARARISRKRGGGFQRVDLDIASPVDFQAPELLLALDSALDAFAALAPRQAKVIEMRYFGGLAEDEIASALKTSTRTVERDFQFAKAWLARELSSR